MHKTLITVAGVLLTMAVGAPAQANTSHDGWPRIDLLLMNKTDRGRPLDARPGHDPFGGTDARYSCDAVHLRGSCQRYFTLDATGGQVVGAHKLHGELLGGHGDDRLHAGEYGDVLWGDYKPSGQPTTQRDTMIGGNGDDFFYASHGFNHIEAGGGDDYVKAHYGHGSIDCGGGTDTLYVSRRAQKHYVIRNCERVSHATLGY